jgi:hypothetical protein
MQTAHIDFSDLATGYSPPNGKQSGGLIFTVSLCGKYLLVGEGCMVYVYELQGDALQPLTCLVCPRRVVAMSMDASLHRLAVAVLLDGRMGVRCDLVGVGLGTNGTSSQLPDRAHHIFPSRSRFQTQFLSSGELEASIETSATKTIHPEALPSARTASA